MGNMWGNYTSKLLIKQDRVHVFLSVHPGKLLVQSLEWLFHNFSETHHITDDVKDNWGNPFSSMQTLCLQNIEPNSE